MDTCGERLNQKAEVVKAGEARTYWVDLGGRTYTVEVAVDQHGLATSEVYDERGELVDFGDPALGKVMGAVREFEGRAGRTDEEDGERRITFVVGSEEDEADLFELLYKHNIRFEPVTQRPDTYRLDMRDMAAP
jgi:hypothetical protein